MPVGGPDDTLELVVDDQRAQRLHVDPALLRDLGEFQPGCVLPSMEAIGARVAVLSVRLRSGRGVRVGPVADRAFGPVSHPRITRLGLRVGPFSVSKR